MTLLPDHLPLSQELLEYYRERIERAELDYQEALDAMESIKVSHDDYHRLAWELHQRTSEIGDLQKALSEAQSFLFEERKQLLKALAENDELRLQELKDRKKIRYLLSVHGIAADQDETTYFKDTLDRRFVRGPAKTSLQQQQQQQQQRNIEEFIEDTLEGDVEALKLRVKSLQAQLDEQSRLYDETVAALKHDREIANEEESIRRQHDTKRIEELLLKIRKLQDFCRDNTREMIEVRKNHQVFERQAKEERTRLLNELSSLRHRLGEEKGKNEIIEKTVESKVLRKTDAAVTELRQALARCENELKQEKQKQEKMELSHQRKVEALKSRVDTLNHSYKTLRKRRDLEIEGFTTDIQTLRKQIKKLEQHILKFGPVEDREIALLQLARETGNRAAKISSELHNLKAKLYDTEREVQQLAF